MVHIWIIYGLYMDYISDYKPVAHLLGFF